MGDWPSGDQIVVTPSVLGEAAATLRAVAVQLREAAPLPAGASAAGDPACAGALAGALRVLGHTVRECADGSDQLALAVLRSAEAYAVADGSAVSR
jgi:hypothetical protein